MNYKEWQEEHPNFITPDIVKLVEKGKKVVELSTGMGLNSRLYGVTVLEETEDGFTSDTDLGLNKCFENKPEALIHFRKAVKAIS